MESKPKVTVIIPTRERADVFRHALRTVIAQEYENLEIIVSDNFSQDETGQVCRSCNDSRIRYLNTGRRISMSDNWEFALGHVTEGWVTIIGDDDGLLPGAVARIAAAAMTPDIEAFRAVHCTYSWPEVVNGRFGRLNVPTTSGVEIRDSMEWLSAVLEGESLCTELPMLYNGGAVHIDVMNRIRAKAGRYFLSCVPDVYSAVAIASMTPRYLYSFEPFAINGASAHSNGRSGGQGGLNVKGTPANKWATEGNIPIHPALCADGNCELIPSVHFWVCEAYLHTVALRSAPDAMQLPRQVALILGKAGRHRSVVNEWAGKMALRYNLDLAGIEREADIIASRNRMLASGRKWKQSLNNYFAGSRTDPIANVFDASQVAGRIHDVHPGRLSSITSLIGRVLYRFF